MRALARATGRALVAPGVVLLATAFPLAAASAAPDPAPLTVAVSSTEVTLSSGVPSTVTVLLTNDGDRRRSVKVVGVPGDPSTEVAATGAKVRQVLGRTGARVRLQAHSSAVVEFQLLVARGSAVVESPVVFVARMPGRPRVVATASLTVKAAAAAAVVGVEFKPDLQNLNEYRPATTELVITNKRDEEVTVQTLAVRSPRDVKLTVSCAGSEDWVVDQLVRRPLKDCVPAIPPLGQVVVPIDVAASDYLAPGGRTIVVEVVAKTRAGESASVVATDDFDVDIFAQSEILAALGVPVFLLLPGAILMLVAPLLIRRFAGWPAFPAPALDLKSLSVVAVFSVGLSLLFALAYPALTDLTGQRRDYLRAQGFEDFYYVFAWAFAVAVCAWLLAGLARLAVTTWTFLFVYREHDRPEDLLRKVAKRSRFGGAVEFQQVQLSAQPSRKGLALRGPSTDEKVFLAPRLVVDPPAAAEAVEAALSAFADEATAKRLRDLRKTIEEAGPTTVALAFDPTDIDHVGDYAAAETQPLTARSSVIRKKDAAP